MADIWLLVIFFIPIILLTVLRVNAVMVYFGLCIGYVLNQFDGGSNAVAQLTNSKVTRSLVNFNNLHLVLLLLPAVVITILLLKTTSGGKLSINLLPAVVVGLLAVILVVPVLPVNTAVSIMNSSLWKDVAKYQQSIIALTSLIMIIMIFIQRSKFNLSKSSKHNKSKN